MRDPVFDQLQHARNQTLRAFENLTEVQADRIPDGFRNSIRWNLGHIYVVLERFAFQYIGLEQLLPPGFKERFEFGTSPLTAHTEAAAPSLAELHTLLSEQLVRIENLLGARIDEAVEPPYVTSTGVKLASIREFLSFNLFHEGMHVGTLKAYKKLVSFE